jgi:opacity protein-like surface antigen
MVGTRLTFSALAIAPFLAGVSAQAADYYQPPPQPIYQPQPIIIQQPAVEFASNWYLRGQIGIGMMSDYKIESTNVPQGGRFASKSIGDSMFFGAGVGYEWNSWLRFDVTAEYRAKSQFTALGTFGTAPVLVDEFKGNLKSYVFLANAFVDLGTWDCFTPFVGLGVGGAYNTISGLTDVTPTVPPPDVGSSFGVGRTTSQWNLAWALYAGVTYNISKSFKVDLTYRYLDLGTANDTINCNGGCGPTKLHITLKDLHSNDFMLAFRWLCCEVAPPPRIVYAPPPPPPIQSKG